MDAPEARGVRRAGDARVKIVLVAHQYWPTPGPAAIRLGALVSALKAKDVDVEVWTTGDGSPNDQTLTGPHGEQIKVIQSSRVRSGTSIKRLMSLAAFARAILLRGRATKEDRVIFVSDPPPTAALATAVTARRSRSPYVFYLCDSWALASDSGGRALRMLRHVFGWMERFAFRRASLTIAVTDGLSQYAESSGASPVIKVQNGADLSTFHADVEPFLPEGVDADLPLLTYAGTAGVVHGAVIFVDAAEVLWAEGLRFQILFIGTGTDMARLAGRAESSDHSGMVVRDAVPPETVARILRASTASLVSLAPGQGYADARPTKALASLAVGTPVVYAGSGAFRDELEAAQVGHFADWDVDTVASAMRDALAAAPLHHDARREIAEYAREQFDSRSRLDDLVDRIVRLASA